TVALTLSNYATLDTWKNGEDTGCRWTRSINATDDIHDQDGLALHESISGPGASRFQALQNRIV
ncbi:MAG: hypothetical protein VX936_03640, partial [Planctomycetota bacterium]|nr:hypothetical protein [Planctomycetota bacterium]